MAGAAATLRWLILGVSPGLFPFVAALASVIPAGAAPASQAAFTIPVIQTVMSDGTIRYGVWLRVGHRIVEAMLDTGSTGLRVLPPVVPGDLTGMPSDATLENGVDLKGLSVPVVVDIGTLSGQIPVEVVDKPGCEQGETECPVPKHGDPFLIGGDGRSGHGFSAILGIGFSSRGQDLPNPLEALGARQWIVELPMPDDPKAMGKLIVGPDAAAQEGFKMAPSVTGGDFFGCLQSKKPEEMICGPMLLDTGATGILAVSQDVESPEIWPKGRGVAFRFRSGQMLSFDAGGAGDFSRIRVEPAKQHRGLGDTFIIAGLFPYYFYDVLYDAKAHKAGLRERGKPEKEAGARQAAIDTPAPTSIDASRTSSPALPAARTTGPRRLPPQDEPNAP